MNSPVKVETRRTQQERKQDAENALLDAAESLIAEQGIEQASLAKIGERAGYSRGLVNHHFGTKDNLLKRLLERYQAGFRLVLDNIAKTSKNSLEALLRSVDAYLEVYQVPGRKSPAFMIMWGAALPPATPSEAISDSEERVLSMITANIEHGQVDGSINTNVDPEAYSVMLLGMLRGIPGETLIVKKELDIAQVRQEVQRFIKQTLKP